MTSGGVMKKIGYFLMVGLAFTALQLSTVSAQTGMPPMGDPMCFDPARGEIPCSEMSGANPNMAPPVSTMPPMGDHSGTPGGPGHHDGPPDCSTIPEPEGRALCETSQARGTPPTAAECATMPTEEGKKNCMEHVGGTP